MFCPHCGAENPDDASFCVECAKPLAPEKSTHQLDQPPPPIPPAPPGPPSAPVQNYLVPAILVTVLCCLPFGVVAIIYASQVNTKLAAGDHAGALEAAQKAKTWSIVSAVSGFVGIVIYLLIAVSQGF